MATSGENSGMAKLTKAQVLQIDRLLRDGVVQREIADRFGVTSVSDIKNGRSWTHVTGRKPSKRKQLRHRKIVLDQSALERFWTKVDKDGPIHPTLGTRCWIWTANAPSGYGSFWLNGTMAKAHRISWTIHNGEIPAKMYVCHHCDNPKCLNPAHLFLGTQKDNMRDASAKDRSARTELTNADVEKYARMYIDGAGKYTFPQLADLAGVSEATMRQAITQASHKAADVDVEAVAAVVASRPNARKLTADQVREIRSRYAAGGISQTQLAAEYGIHDATISLICSRKRWQHVE